MKKLKPQPLKKGDRIAIIAPSTPGDREKVKRSEHGLRAMGLEPVFYPSCFSYHGHLAGLDEERIRDIHDAFLDESIKGIICMKGGSGATRLLDKLDYDLIARNPKVFIGYSDITALHLAFQSQCHLVTFHGPMALSDMYHYDGENVTIDTYSGTYYRKNIFDAQPLGRVDNPEGIPIETLVPGHAEGEIVGGNLSLVLSTLGSPYEIDTRGKILFLEDTNEATYVVDRMLSALALAGKFRDCAGIILGTWVGCNPEIKNSYPGEDLSLSEIFDEVIKPWNKPTVTGLYGGHNTPQMMFPLGVKVKLDATHQTIEFIESPYEEAPE